MGAFAYLEVSFEIGRAHYELRPGQEERSAVEKAHGVRVVATVTVR